MVGRVAAPEKHSQRPRLENSKNPSNRARRLRCRPWVSRQRISDAAVRCTSVVRSALAQARCKPLPSFIFSHALRLARLEAAAVQPREHACAFAAGLPSVPMSVVGVWIESPHAQAYARARSAHGLMTVTVSNDCGCRWQADGHISSEGSGGDGWAVCFGSRSTWLQLVS